MLSTNTTEDPYPTLERLNRQGIIIIYKELHTSFIFVSSGPWASFVCLIFSTIFLINAWLLFSFLAINISRTNQRHLKKNRKEKQETKIGC